MSESKQDIVVKLVKEGIHPRAVIKDEADCTSGALASYLSGMRNAAKYTGDAICPIEIELDDGTKVFVAKTFAEVEAIKEERAANRGVAASKKSPEERFELAEKRLIRCESAVDKFNERIDATDSEISEEVSLRKQKADIELRLAEIEVARCQELVSSAPDVEEDEAEIVTAEDELL